MPRNYKPSVVMIGLLVCVALLLQAVAAVNVTVDLGYARYRGKDVGNGINRWAGMRYARSVSRVDGLRFTAPQEPLEEANKVTTDASKVSITQKLHLTVLMSAVWTSLHRLAEQPPGRIRQQVVGGLSLRQCVCTRKGYQHQQTSSLCLHPRRWLQHERQCKLRRFGSH